MLNNITIYAAGPIDLGTDIPNWRKLLVECLHGAGQSAVLFDPSTAYKSAMWGEPDLSRTRYIEDVNKVALQEANFFVVCLPKTVASVGTPIELDWAYKAAKNIILITDISNGQSVYLDNRVHPGTWVKVDFKDNKSVENGLYKVSDLILTNLALKDATGYASFD